MLKMKSKIMKRLLITIALVIVMTTGMSAMTLQEAFNALSSVQNISMTKAPETSSINYNSPSDSVSNVKIAAASDLGASSILQTGNAVYTILNQVPLEFMINGANNNLACAFIYATPCADDRYDCLMVLMSGYAGDVAIVYMTCDKSTKEKLQNANVSIHGPSLTVTNPGESYIDITIGPDINSAKQK